MKDSLFAQALVRKLRFGIHPTPNRSPTAALPIRELPLPERLAVSCAMHFRDPARPVVEKGDAVKFGQRIAEPSGLLSAAVHAPAAGVVADIENRITPSGRLAQTILIETEPSACEPPLAPMDWQTASPGQLLARVEEAGIVGMGGAGFPTHVKLAPPPGTTIDTVILNGAECEPWLTADNRIMLERAPDIWAGCRILRKILGARQICVDIEENKPGAIKELRKAMDASPDPYASSRVCVLHSSYPQGAEKQQIEAVTGRVVPAGGLPRDVGCVVDNAATALAVFKAVALGLPLTHRVITVSGDAVQSPANVRVPNGTPFSELIAFCGGAKPGLCKLVAGGPMMGFAQPDAEASTGKTTSGLLLFSEALAGRFASTPCVSCGRCVDACPMRLLPCEITQCAEANDIAAAEKLRVSDCYECGACAWVCPARRPMVQHIRRAKAALSKK